MSTVSIPRERRRSSPGRVILTEVMHLFGVEQVEVSEHDILRGAALGL